MKKYVHGISMIVKELHFNKLFILHLIVTQKMVLCCPKIIIKVI